MREFELSTDLSEALPADRSNEEKVEVARTGRDFGDHLYRREKKVV